MSRTATSECLAPGHDSNRHVRVAGTWACLEPPRLRAWHRDVSRSATGAVVILHAIVSDFGSALEAVDAGATVVQLRLKDASTEERVAVGGAFGALDATFVVNDDVDAALALGADGVHLGQGDEGAERTLEAGLLLGISVANRREAAIAEYLGANYIGAGAIWATPSKEDAPAIGLDALREICMSVTVPVIAIGGIDASNAADCIRAGAAGVAVIRAAGDPALRAALDAAL